VSAEITITYEVIGRAIVRRQGDPREGGEEHSLKLLYRGDGTPWWTCSAGLELPIPADFEAQPGDFITTTLKVKP